MRCDMNDIEKKLSHLNGTEQEDYIAYLERLIRMRYSVSAEIAILRQRDTKPIEFEEYNAYVEDCKRKAKRAFDIDGG